MIRKNLTHTTIERIKPDPIRVLKYTDANGLFLEVRPTGVKIFRYRYRIDGRENLFTIGEFGNAPDQVTLAVAREKRAAAAALVAKGQHPRAEEQKEIRERILEAKNVVAVTAEEWYESRLAFRKNGEPLAPHYLRQLRDALDIDILPAIGNMEVRDVKASHVADILNSRAEAPTMAKLAQRVIRHVFRFAIRRDRCEHDPTLGCSDIFHSEIPIPKTQHHPHLEAKDIAGFLNAVENMTSRNHDNDLAVLRLAVKIAFFTGVRPNEIMQGEWKEIDWNNALWLIPEKRMKMSRPHLVPLSRQVVVWFRELHALTGTYKTGRFMIPERSATKRKGEVPKVVNALARVIRQRTGHAGRITAHGFRGTASTFLNNQVNRNKEKRFATEWVELQLSHSDDEAYNHAAYLDQRRDMMQFYADTFAPMGPKIVRMKNVA